MADRDPVMVTRKTQPLVSTCAAVIAMGSSFAMTPKEKPRGDTSARPDRSVVPAVAQAALNLSSLIASELITVPPTRRTA